MRTVQVKKPIKNIEVPAVVRKSLKANYDKPRRRTDNFRQTEAVPCRAVVITMDRSRGIPLSCRYGSEVSGGVMSEDVLVGLGLLGVYKHGQVFARIGFYGFSGADLSFKYAVNFDIDSDDMDIKPDHGNMSESERAMVNWIKAALFSNEIEAGNYHLKIDDVCNIANGDPAYEQGLWRLMARLPRRREFASERRLTSAFEMWDEYLEADPARQDAPLQRPDYIPLVIADQVPGELFEMDGSISILPSVQVSCQTFRNFAAKRLSCGLGVIGGDSRQIKAAYFQSLDNIDRNLYKGREVVLRSILERMQTSTREQATKYIKRMDPKGKYEQQRMEDIELAISALRTYAQQRMPDDKIQMYVEPTAADMQDPIKAFKLAKAGDIFSKPFSGLIKTNCPVQIVEGFMSTGALPQNGLDIFQ